MDYYLALSHFLVRPNVEIMLLKSKASAYSLLFSIHHPFPYMYNIQAFSILSPQLCSISVMDSSKVSDPRYVLEFESH